MIMHPQLPQSIMRKVMDTYRSIVSRISMLLQMTGAANPELEARVLVPALDAISMMYLLDKEQFPLDTIAGHLIGKYCHDTK